MTRKSAPARELGERWLEGIRHIRQRRAIRVAHAHVEAARALRDRAPDAPEPEDAEPLAAHARGQRIVAALPLAAPQVTIGRADAARDVDQHADREVGHAIVQHVGRVADSDAPAPRGLQVDLVEADPEARDHAQLRQPVDELRVGAEIGRSDEAAELGAVRLQKRRGIVVLPQPLHVVAFVELRLERRHQPALLQHLGSGRRHRRQSIRTPPCATTVAQFLRSRSKNAVISAGVIV